MYWATFPSGKRMMAPAKMGTESMKPTWAGLRLEATLWMNGAMAPFITQTPQQ